MSLRISGLVRFYDGVRAALARGIPLEEREAFRRRIADTLRTVEELCFEHGAWPNELPAPSSSSAASTSNTCRSPGPARDRRPPSA
jgi:hypothetical protein